MAHKNKPFKAVSIDNIYRLDGRVPIAKAIPFGLQHVLAMFVSNLAPITIIAAAAQPALSTEQVGMLLQNAMFIAGIATMIQLYPIWRIGSRLPIVMGVSFTFVTILCSIASNYGYPTMLGAVLIGGLMEGTLGLFARHLVHYIKPIVSASVVTGIGLSLFTVGTRSFGGGYADDFGSAKNLIIGTVTLAVCLVWTVVARGYLKQLSVLAGLIVGYVLSIFLGKVDLSTILSGGIISLPHLLMFRPEFNIGAILSVCVIFLVSAAETIGDTSAMVSGGLGRTITQDEISGSLAVDGYASAVSSLFGCPPVTSFSQNVGLIAMTKVVNRFTIMTGAIAMVLAGLIPSDRKLLRLPAPGSPRRMYDYDVRPDPSFRYADDCRLRLQPEKHYRRLPVTGGRRRLHRGIGAGYLGYFPEDRAGRLQRKCCGSGLCCRNDPQLRAPGKYGSNALIVSRLCDSTQNPAGIN